MCVCLWLLGPLNCGVTSLRTMEGIFSQLVWMICRWLVLASYCRRIRVLQTIDEGQAAKKLQQGNSFMNHG